MAKARAGKIPSAFSDYWKEASLPRTNYTKKPKVVSGNEPYDDNDPNAYFIKRSQLKSGKTSVRHLNKVKAQLITPEGALTDKEYTLYPISKGYTGFTANTVDSATRQKRLALAKLAFEPEPGEPRPFGEPIEADGVGHIAHLKYAYEDATHSGILEVTFENGDICDFFDVPVGTAGMLFHLAKSKQTYGTYKKNGKNVPRHLLGVYFWDLIRIRHHRIGALKPFEYNRGESGRFETVVNRKVFTVKAGDLPGLVRQRLDPTGTFKDDEAITVVLNGGDKDTREVFRSIIEQDSEFKYNADIRRKGRELHATQEELERMEEEGRYSADSGRPITNTSSMIAENIDSINDQLKGFYKKIEKDPNLRLKSIAGIGKTNNVGSTIDFKYGELSNVFKAILTEANNDKLAPEQRLYSEYYADAKRLSPVVGRHGLKQFVENPVNITEANRAAHVANGQYLTNFATGKVLAHSWTAEELKAIAPKYSMSVTASTYNRYMKYLESKDWAGALQMLKTTDVPVRFKNSANRNIAFAGQNDTIEGDEE